MSRTFRAILALAMLALLAAPARAQQAAAGTLKGQTLFKLHTGVGSITAAERADVVNRRLERLTTGTMYSTKPNVEKTEVGWMIMVGKQPVLLVMEADARAEKMDGETLAKHWASILGNALVESRSASLRDLLWRLAVTFIVLACGIGLLLGLRWGRKRLEKWLEERQERLPALRLGELELVSNQKVDGGLRAARRFA